jgi:3-hydroxypropanoate dehydrogenase
MQAPINDNALDQLFRQARSRNAWTDQSVPETLIRATYELTKMGPTSANCSPARFVFIGSKEGKEKLRPYLAPGNVDKTMAAPWVAIVAYDMDFYERIPELFPHAPGARNWFSGSPEMIHETAFRNGTLQGAYLMLAARALGFDCGPMSGFDRTGVDAAFFADDPVMRTWKSNFLCNIGYGSEVNLFDRSPRLSFDDACRIM